MRILTHSGTTKMSNSYTPSGIFDVSNQIETELCSIRRSVFPLAHIEASLAKPDLNAPTSVSISASVIGVEKVHVPVLMMLQPSL